MHGYITYMKNNSKNAHKKHIKTTYCKILECGRISKGWEACQWPISQLFQIITYVTIILKIYTKVQTWGKITCLHVYFIVSKRWYLYLPLKLRR